MAIGPPIKRRQLFILAMAAALAIASGIFYSGKFFAPGTIAIAQEQEPDIKGLTNSLTATGGSFDMAFSLEKITRR